MTEVANIAAALSTMAARMPDAVALQVPRGRERDGRRRYVAYTYRELDQASDRIARGFDSLGVARGARAAVLVTPGFEFFAVVFGLFKAGAVPVLVDPGIGARHLRACLDEAEPMAFIGVPKAHAARVLFGWAKRTVRVRVTVGRRWGWGGLSLDALERRGEACGVGALLVRTAPDDTAAILFTSGSTGAPKGVVYEHRHFVAQVELIRTAYGIEPGEVDVPTFPLFGLFDPALGMTTVLPDMDFTRPARIDPTHVIDIVERFGVTNMFGSPAVLDTLGRYGSAHDASAARPLLPTLRRVISAGAPVSGVVLTRMRELLPFAAQIHTPYGATENLPVSTVSDAFLLGEAWAKTREGAGVCVGLPLAANDVRVIRIDDGAIPSWSEDLEVPAGVVGELTVLGPTTTERYFQREEATCLAKIAHGGRVRHRMGDLGYVDAAGRLWFCGRKAHRVRTAERELYTTMVEGVFDAHPAVRRSALVGVGEAGSSRPVVWLELEEKGHPPLEALFAELRALGARREHTARIDTFLVHPAFPVDIRHNAKVGYAELTRAACARLGFVGRGEAR